MSLSVLDRIDSPRDLDALTYEELAGLASDCRMTIIDTITTRGGHLASNLGAVELTLALHRVFNSPHDRIVWDTSNQTYTHKLITGRRDQFASIRTPGGLSGFAEPTESDHDTLAAGHAGTGLSYALGMSLALQNAADDPYVIAVVGDGALTSGPSYEALNNIVHLSPKRLILVLNDNGWSISENIGWLCDWRNRLLSSRGEAREPADGRRAADTIWQELGIRYLGPIDGHDQRTLEETLRNAKHAESPILIHVLTHKGRGYQPAEENPPKFHQPGTPSAAINGSGTLTYSQVFAKTMIELMSRDERVVAISAAMLEGTALNEVKRRFPARVYDVGIAEEHAVIMAAGMAKAGLRPFVAIYSTFLQRSFDQLIHDVALQRLPVTICIDRAGFVGDDGKTHQGVFDIAYTRVVPNMIVAAPKDENELQHLLVTALESNAPFAIRYPRGLGAGVPLDDDLRAIAVGRGEVLHGGRDLTLFAYGSMVGPAIEAATILNRSGIECGVINARFASPLDEELIENALQQSPRLLTLEEHLAAGGFGSAVLECVERRQLDAAGVRVHAVPNQFIEHAPQAKQRATFKLDAHGIVDVVLDFYPDLALAKREVRAHHDDARQETVTW
jgi:1-deoxy-D-xylulose-5-phosphate synthase